MQFPRALPRALRESLNEIDLRGEVGDFLEQLATHLRRGFDATGATVFLVSGPSRFGVSAGEDLKLGDLDNLVADKCREHLATCAFSVLGLANDGYMVPVGSELVVREKFTPGFQGSIFIGGAKLHQDTLQHPLLLPLVLSSAIDRVLLRQESFPIGTFAHDIKHYLLLCSAACERLAETSTPSEAVRSIQSAVQRMQVLTSTLLLTERDRAQQLRLQPIRLSVGQLVNEVLTAFQPIAERLSINLTASSDSNTDVDADPALLPSVITNLIDNALKYCPRGSTVSAKVAATTQEVVLTVSDDGPGIPENEHCAIFERGYRVGGTTSASGHGFGLAIVRKIVDLHGGSIRVQAAPGGKGVSFVITLPRHRIIS